MDASRLRSRDDNIHRCSRHPTFFFEDGSVILRAENTLFRVQRSYFASQSAQLRDLLDPRIQDTLWGIQFVSLNGDCADDVYVAAFIESIYGGFYMTERELNVETFPRAASVLRMSARYGVDRTRDAVMTLIKASTERNEVKLYWLKLAPEGPGHCKQAADQEHSMLHPAPVVALLREVGCDDTPLLAAVFHDLSRRSWDLSENALESLEPLSAADRECYILGVTKLRVSYVLNSRSPPTIQVAHAQPVPCTTGLKTFWNGIAKDLHSANAETMADPMGGLQAIMEISWKEFTGTICSQCHTEFLSYMLGQQTGMWDGLGATFCL
ncbi:hypothetical protein EVG20_g5635 [Dentipellis fragilis]|uniref:BTB domain-containing protein n=1 Tax=Dentipellis fragilis TaxID=205917 RepID=A0A4Y9YUG7_9AGAM|nr:hypothetical protein EVG20_g5635 [Dentipellis fragilis]